MKMATKWIQSARQLLPVLVMSGMFLDGRLILAQADSQARAAHQSGQVDEPQLVQRQWPVVEEEAQHDVSPPIFLMTPALRQTAQRVRAVKPIPRPAANGIDASSQVIDPLVQSSATILAPATLVNVDGVGDGFTGPAGAFSVSSAPSGSNGDVGPNHYVQVVNSDFAVFNKSGAAIFGPVPTNTLWSGFGGGCQSNNDGDAVVLYDPISDRWVISQFSVSTIPYLQCVAVSQTPDPTGTYSRYSFAYGNTDFPDYPKMGVWPDAYYVTFNMFAGGITASGAKVCAYDRAKMLLGQAATQQCFNTSTSGMLPADFDGTRLPPVGAPNPLVALGTNPNELAIWKFHVDWSAPANSTLSGPTTLITAAFNEACGGGTCIPQAGTAQLLDSISDRLMFRFAYRNFPDHQALVVNHSVTAGSSVGVRWYELRLDSSGNPSIFQQGTYAPDANYRWMGSIAQDQQGNIALGFSLSSSAVHPEIHYTGRLVGDPAGTMSQGEGTIMNGLGSQTGSALSRWGDYSMMAVDPTDDCTFWYTNQYIPANGAFNWRTRVGSFKLPGCAATGDFSMTASPASLSVPRGSSATSTISAVVTLGNPQSVSFSVSGVPNGATATLSPASLTASGSSTLTVNAGTAAPGAYLLTVKGTGTFSTHSTSVQLIIASPTTTSLSVNMDPVLRRQYVTLTAQVAGTQTPAPAGLVTFLEGTKVIGTANLDSTGVARLSTFFTTLGIHTITASYSGDLWNVASISPPLEEEVDIRILEVF